MADWPSVVTSALRLFASAEPDCIAQIHDDVTPTQILFQLICNNHQAKKYQKMMLNIDLAALHLSIHYEVCDQILKTPHFFWLTSFSRAPMNLQALC